MSLAPNGRGHSISQDREVQESQLGDASGQYFGNRTAEWFSEGGLSQRRPLQSSEHFAHSQSSTVGGLLNAYLKICQRWRLTEAQQMTLLGYPGADLFFSELRGGHTTFISQDTKDRIGYILSISIGLGALFNENEAAELDWLNQTQDSFGGRTAIQFMLQGKMQHISAVADAVLHERNPW